MHLSSWFKLQNHRGYIFFFKAQHVPCNSFQSLHWILQSFIVRNVHQSGPVTLIIACKSGTSLFPLALCAPNISILYAINLSALFILRASPCSSLEPEASWHWWRGGIVHGDTKLVAVVLIVGGKKRGEGSGVMFLMGGWILKLVFDIFRSVKQIDNLFMNEIHAYLYGEIYTIWFALWEK
jgi:hypothetical protein